MIHSSKTRFISISGRVQRFSKIKSNQYQSLVKCLSYSTDNVIKSSYPDIQISKLSLSNFLLENFKDYADKKAITCGASGRSYKYKEVAFMSERLAKAYLAIRGCNLRRNDTIGVLLPNIPEFVPAVLGANKAGLRVTFANPLYTADEICRQFEVANVKMMITLSHLLPISKFLKSNLDNYRGTICIGGSDDRENNVFDFQSLIATDHIADLPTVNPKDIAIVPFSSGTSGVPKGVLLTNENCTANLNQISAPDFNRGCGEGRHENVLTIPPFFHIYGFNGVLNMSLLHGCNVITLPKFTPDDYIKSLVVHKPTILFLVPSLMLFLATHPLVTKEMLKPVTEVLIGAAAATPQLQEKFRSKCTEKVEIRQGYGMTEASPCTLLTPLNAKPSKCSSSGQLLPNTIARIVSVDDGTVLGPNKSGELQFKGPQIMQGYLNNEEATKETIDEDGWLKTGDIAYYDDDFYFYIVDRTKELIKVKGNQVSPTELENIILELDGVTDVAVTGILDEFSDEIPRAYVVLKPNCKLTEADIKQHVKNKWIKYKWLEGGVKFIKAVPRNHSGKILRKDLQFLDENNKL